MNINVLFCFDEKYQQHFGVALTSLLINNGTHHIKAHLLTKDVNSSFQEKLDTLKKEFDFSYFIYEISEAEIEKFPVSRHISLAAYYRLLAPKVLPDNLDKVLYLDSDLVVNGSLDALYSKSLSDKPLAAVGQRVVTTKKRLDLQGNFYFNSGVMLLNLDTWNEKHISERCFKFLIEESEKAKLWDQDALNKVVDGDFVFLEKKWNTLLDLYENHGEISSESVILHYVGSLKPWQMWCVRPNKKYYWKYLKASPWRTALPTIPHTRRELFSAANSLKQQAF